MRLFRQCREVGLRYRLVLDVQHYGEAEAATLARTDGHRTNDLRVGRVLFVLRGNVVRPLPDEATRFLNDLVWADY